MKPLVSVITPTWQRHEKLLNGCIPSVQAQTYRRVEHVIVSDAPDLALAAKLAELSDGQAFYHPVRYVQLAGPHPGVNRYGSEARNAGIASCRGDLVAYIDDDDRLRPEHVAKLAALFDDDEKLMWAYSLMESHSHGGLATHIGCVPPMPGQIGTPMIMHRAGITSHGDWGPPGTMEDWELVQRWLAAGLPYAHLPEATVDVWPSAYWG